MYVTYLQPKKLKCHFRLPLNSSAHLVIIIIIPSPALIKLEIVLYIKLTHNFLVARNLKRLKRDSKCNILTEGKLVKWAF